MAKKDNNPAFVKRDTIVSGKEYARLLSDLKERFRRSQIKAAVKVNTEMLEFYWTMGREISRLHQSAKWGSAFFDCLSLDLKTEFPNQAGFSSANIRYTKRWYEFYNQDNTILQRLIEEFSDPNRHQVCEDLGMPVHFNTLVGKFEPFLKKLYFLINNRELTTCEGSADSTTFSDCIFGHDSLKRLKHTTDVRYYRFRDYLDKVRGWRNEEAHSAPEIPDAELREAVHILVTMYAYVIAKSLPELEG